MDETTLPLLEGGHKKHLCLKVSQTYIHNIKQDGISIRPILLFPVGYLLICVYVFRCKMKLTFVLALLGVTFVIVVDETVAEVLSEERSDVVWANYKVSFIIRVNIYLNCTIYFQCYLHAAIH